jgi:hypothetical protein
MGANYCASVVAAPRGAARVPKTLIVVSESEAEITAEPAGLAVRLRRPGRMIQRRASSTRAPDLPIGARALLIRG